MPTINYVIETKLDGLIKAARRVLKQDVSTKVVQRNSVYARAARVLQHAERMNARVFAYAITGDRRKLKELADCLQRAYESLR